MMPFSVMERLMKPESLDSVPVSFSSDFNGERLVPRCATIGKDGQGEHIRRLSRLESHDVGDLIP
jgi:hypothetical protein